MREHYTDIPRPPAARERHAPSADHQTGRQERIIERLVASAHARDQTGSVFSVLASGRSWGSLWAYIRDPTSRARPGKNYTRHQIICGSRSFLRQASSCASESASLSNCSCLSPVTDTRSSEHSVPGLPVQLQASGSIRDRKGRGCPKRPDPKHTPLLRNSYS